MDSKKALNLISKICNPGDKDIMKLGIGGVIEYKDKKWVVDQVYKYLELTKKGKETGFSWVEYQMIDPFSGEAIYVELEHDDELEATVTIEEVFGVEVEGKVARYEGMEFFRREAGKAKCLFGSKGYQHSGSEVVFMEDFVGKSGALSYERWDSNELFFLYKSVDPTEFRVLAGGFQ